MSLADVMRMLRNGIGSGVFGGLLAFAGWPYDTWQYWVLMLIFSFAINVALPPGGHLEGEPKT